MSYSDDMLFEVATPFPLRRRFSLFCIFVAPVLARAKGRRRDEENVLRRLQISIVTICNNT